jgi:hypothetical protein
MAWNPRSAFRQLQQQAHRLLADLRIEISAREAELRRLEEQTSKLSALAGEPRVAPTANRAARPARRIDWRALLAQLPRRFSVPDVRSMGELRNKGSAQIFAGIR